MEKSVIYCVFLGKREGSINRMFIGKKELSLKEKLMLSPEELLKVTKSARDTNLTHALLTPQSLRGLAKNGKGKKIKKALNNTMKIMCKKAKCGHTFCDVAAYYSWPTAWKSVNKIDAFYDDANMLEKIGDALRCDGFKTEMWYGTVMCILRISWGEGR